jgi:hypothetical protein
VNIFAALFGAVVGGARGAVVEADKKGLLLLDASPQSEAVKDVIRIKEILEA